MMKIVDIDEENLLNNQKNFNEILRKDATYDNVKRHKKTELHPVTRRYIFRKTIWGGRVSN